MIVTKYYYLIIVFTCEIDKERFIIYVYTNDNMYLAIIWVCTLSSLDDVSNTEILNLHVKFFYVNVQPNSRRKNTKSIFWADDLSWVQHELTFEEDVIPHDHQ